MSGGYNSVPRYEAPTESIPKSYSPTPTVSKTPAFKGTGMKLGKKVKQSDLLEAMAGEVITPDEIPTTHARAPSPEPVIQLPQVALPTVTRKRYALPSHRYTRILNQSF